MISLTRRSKLRYFVYMVTKIQWCLLIKFLAFETEMTKAGADWQVHAYGNTMHAFTNPAANNPDFGTMYDEVAERRTYQALANFLDEIF